MAGTPMPIEDILIRLAGIEKLAVEATGLLAQAQANKSLEAQYRARAAEKTNEVKRLAAEL